MVKYDPNNPLSEEELDKLGKEDFDSFLEYLDSKAEYLKQFTKPLGQYHTKRFAAANAASRDARHARAARRRGWRRVLAGRG